MIDLTYIHDYYLNTSIKMKDIVKKKIEMNRKKEKDFSDFYPNSEDLKALPSSFWLIHISFVLKTPYTSRDDLEPFLYKEEEKENAIVRDKLTGLAIVTPTTWKGHLRYAAEKVEWDEEEKEVIIKRLFGTSAKDDSILKGRLHFFPTFFEENDVSVDVITPLNRIKRKPSRRGPIFFEIIKSKGSGDFYVLYVPYPKSNDAEEKVARTDLKFLDKALNLMFYTYGFSAMKTSGYGTISEREHGNGFELLAIWNGSLIRSSLSEFCNALESDSNEGLSRTAE